MQDLQAQVVATDQALQEVVQVIMGFPGRREASASQGDTGAGTGSSDASDRRNFSQEDQAFLDTQKPTEGEEVAWALLEEKVSKQERLARAKAAYM